MSDGGHMSSTHLSYIRRNCDCILCTDLPGLSQVLKHSCLLDELVFWMVKFEFPEKLVTLLLSLLPDEHYKVNIPDLIPMAGQTQLLFINIKTA